MRSRLLTASAVLALAACSRDAGPTAIREPQPISAAEAQAIGRETAGEAGGMASSFTVGDLFLFGFEFGDVGEFGGFGAPALSPTAMCPTITPMPPVDADSDRVPDDLTLTFTLPACSFSHDGGTVAVTGTIHITDPTPTTHDIAHRVEFGDLEKKFTLSDGTFFLRRLAGARQVLRSEAGFSAVDSTTGTFESSRDGSSSLAKAWAVSFVADSGATSVQEDWRLPSGTFTINGSTTRTRASLTRSLSVQTVTPLHFDAACTAEPQFTAGELLITRTGFEHSGTIHVVFTGCGTPPTITMTAT
jgi:hypothetical protein